jgi:hypothetical protein
MISHYHSNFIKKIKLFKLVLPLNLVNSHLFTKNLVKTGPCTTKKQGAVKNGSVATVKIL